MSIHTIVTHRKVDLDSVISVCAHLIRHNINMYEANILFSPDPIPEGATLIDIGPDKHPDGFSYCSSHFNDFLPPFLVSEVARVDAGEKSSILSAMIGALRRVNCPDLMIIRAFYPFVYGWSMMVEDERKADQIFDSIEKVEIANYRFIKYSGNKPVPGLSHLASRRGFVGSIYENGNNIGITRFPTFNKPDLRPIFKFVSSKKVTCRGRCFNHWFSHPNGFLLCWGSSKSPALVPPPITVDELIEIARDILYEGGGSICTGK